jgi:hypothetical protein
MMEPPQVPTIDLADGALTGPAQETAAAGVAIAVVLVVVGDSELVLVVVDAWEPHPAPASASAVAPTATENFNSNPSFAPNRHRTNNGFRSDDLLQHALGHPLSARDNVVPVPHSHRTLGRPASLSSPLR